jgi:actin related protein 2/3 complex subunit 2
MILLEPESKIIQESLTDKLNTQFTTLLADFDQVRYKITCDKSLLLFSIYIHGYEDLLRYQLNDYLNRVYGQYGEFITPETGYSLTLSCRLDLVQDHAELVKRLSLFKMHVLACPFELAMKSQKNGIESDLMTIKYRDQEAIFVKSQRDRVTVIFSIKFEDENDKIYSKVFIQEFVDARKQPLLQNAPQVLFSKDAPLELKDSIVDREDIGYITFGN